MTSSFGGGAGGQAQAGEAAHYARAEQGLLDARQMMRREINKAKGALSATVLNNAAYTGLQAGKFNNAIDLLDQLGARFENHFDSLSARTTQVRTTKLAGDEQASGALHAAVAPASGTIASGLRG